MRVKEIRHLIRTAGWSLGGLWEPSNGPVLVLVTKTWAVVFRILKQRPPSCHILVYLLGVLALFLSPKKRNGILGSSAKRGRAIAHLVGPKVTVHCLSHTRKNRPTLERKHLVVLTYWTRQLQRHTSIVLTVS